MIDEFDRMIKEYHRVLGAFMKGDSEPARHMFSIRDDVSLGNPFGPFVRGPAGVSEAMKAAAAHYRDGDAVGFDTISKCVTPDLAYLVEIEHLRSKVGGRNDLSQVNLRATSVFRKEEAGWKLVHRHADPITAPRSAESVLPP